MRTIEDRYREMERALSDGTSMQEKLLLRTAFYSGAEAVFVSIQEVGGAPEETRAARVKALWSEVRETMRAMLAMVTYLSTEPKGKAGDG